MPDLGAEVQLRVAWQADAPGAFAGFSTSEPTFCLPRLLIVEDDQDFRDTLCEEARSRGYTVYEAKSGLEAKAMWAEQEPEVCVTDLMMPGMNGLELAAELNTYGLLRPSVILMSGDGEINSSQLLRCPVDQIFEKPFKMDDLFESVQYATMHRRMLRRYCVLVDESVAKLKEVSCERALHECTAVIKSFAETMSMSWSSIMVLMHTLERARSSVAARDDALERISGIASLLQSRNQQNLATLMGLEKTSAMPARQFGLMQADNKEGETGAGHDAPPETPGLS